METDDDIDSLPFCNPSARQGMNSDHSNTVSASIVLSINGRPWQMPASSCVAELVHRLHPEQRVAVELNGEIVPRSEYAQRRLHSGDEIEIVQAIGGG